ncbi:unnamed protein product [Allacma fusca]|uniref:Uncharacterized protein n=1 Tax=Allacma fusca TaxID=39272 RepID=A0A8J2MCW2_9HEXA|nr:unnamed protein product [Allacma fusca]
MGRLLIILRIVTRYTYHCRILILQVSILKYNIMDVAKSKADLDKENRRLEDSSKRTFRQFLYVVVTALLFLWVLQSQIVPVSSSASHAHAHNHDHGHDHGHAHGGHDHGHAHGGHDHGHAHEHEDHGHAHGHEEPPSFKYSKQANEQFKAKEIPKATTPPPPPVVERNPNLWLEAISSTLLISVAPFAILFWIPLDNSKEKEAFLKVLLSFASGGLLGDAFLHLIPHAILAVGSNDGHGHSHSHGHSHGHEEKQKYSEDELSEFHGHDLSVGIWVLVGIVTFLVVEKLIRIAKGGHFHSHSHSSPAVEASKSGTDKKKKTSPKPKGAGKDSPDSKADTNEDSPAVAVAPEGDGDIKVAGYLNLAADFTHNFTDGLAIGASYLAGRNVGIITTVTVLLHEIPHEIGDFAILIQSGCNKRKAIFLQLTTAVGAVSGTIVSLLAEGVGDAATSWILPFTAGGFIYIATVSVIPELLHNSTFKQSLKEIIALLAGVYMMVLIANFQPPPPCIYMYEKC